MPQKRYANYYPKRYSKYSRYSATPLVVVQPATSSRPAVVVQPNQSRLNQILRRYGPAATIRKPTAASLNRLTKRQLITKVRSLC